MPSTARATPSPGTAAAAAPSMVGDARRQRMSAVYQPVGEVESIVIAALWFFWKRGKEGGDAAGDLFAGVVIFTPFHDEAISLLR